MGYDEKGAASVIVDDYKRLVENAVRNGESPAKAAYNLAKMRGFTGEAPKEADKKESLKDLAKKQEASGSLSSGPGKSGRDELTVEDAATLSQAEFEKKFSGPEGKKAWERLWQ